MTTLNQLARFLRASRGALTIRFYPDLGVYHASLRVGRGTCDATARTLETAIETVIAALGTKETKRG